MHKKLHIDDALFGLIYILGMFDSVFLWLSTAGDLPHAGRFSTVIRLAAASFVIVKLIVDRFYKLNTILYMASAGLLVLVCFINSHYNHLFYFLLILLSSRNIDLYKAIQLDFYARIVLISFIILLGLTGLIENYVTYRTGSEMLRYSLGFLHPNTLASFMLGLIMEDAWLHRRKFSGLYCIVIWSISIIVYLITLNRTSVLIAVLFPFFVIPLSNATPRGEIGRFSGFFLKDLYALLTLFSLIAMLNCNHSLVLKGFDILLSNRFSNAYRVFQNYGVSLFGQSIKLVSVKMARLFNYSISLLDVAYIRLMLQGGCILLVFMAVLYRNLTTGILRANDRYTLLIVCLFMLYGIGESGFNNVYMNFTLILAARGVYHHDEIPQLN